MPRSRNQEWLHDIKIGKELRYPKDVIDSLKSEPDAVRRNSILRNARYALIGRK